MNPPGVFAWGIFFAITRIYATISDRVKQVLHGGEYGQIIMARTGGSCHHVFY